MKTLIVIPNINSILATTNELDLELTEQRDKESKNENSKSVTAVDKSDCTTDLKEFNAGDSKYPTQLNAIDCKYLTTVENQQVKIRFN